MNIRNKGSSGELELCKRLQPFFLSELRRNLEQVRSGGSDIDGSWPFVIECKRVEDIGMGNRNAWWRQVCKALVSESEIPVVAFRQNRSNWRYLLPASLIVSGNVDWCEVSEETFLQFVIQVLRGPLSGRPEN